MTFLIGALILGFLMARLPSLPALWHGKIALLGRLALILLLFSMGISLGANPGLMTSLPSLGIKALILALGTIGGSVAFVWFGLVLRRSKS